jgi:hypothetical protein
MQTETLHAIFSNMLILFLLSFAPAIAVFIYASYQDDKAKFKKGALWILGVNAALVILLGILNYVQNWKFDNEGFGKKYNSIRQQAGIDTIPSNWVLKNPQIRSWFDRFKQIDNDYTLHYLNPDSATNPAHIEKVIWVEEDKIKAELDSYKNNQQIIETYYNHIQKSLRKDYFLHDNRQGEYTISEIDSILNSWR